MSINPNDPALYEILCSKCKKTVDRRVHRRVHCPRPVITTGSFVKALDRVKAALHRRINEKGPHAFASIHEIDGILREEYVKEFGDAVHQNNHPQAAKELEDIAVGCIFGIACIEQDALDW